MSFTPSIPQSGQTLGQTQQSVQNNFTNYNNVVSQDHVSPNSTGQGKHNKSTYKEQGSDPVTIADELAAYAKAVSGISQLFLRPESAGTPVQMSRLDTGASTANADNSNGWTFLPGGLIFQWGYGQFAGTASAVIITFATSNISFPNYCYGVWPIGIGFSNVFAVDSVTKLGFTADRYPATGSGIGADQNFYWIALGK